MKLWVTRDTHIPMEWPVALWAGLAPPCLQSGHFRPPAVDLSKPGVEGFRSAKLVGRLPLSKCEQSFGFVPEPGECCEMALKRRATGIKVLGVGADGTLLVETSRSLAMAKEAAAKRMAKEAAGGAAVPVACDFDGSVKPIAQISLQCEPATEDPNACTCPIIVLTSSGCPKMRGSKECAK